MAHASRAIDAGPPCMTTSRGYLANGVNPAGRARKLWIALANGVNPAGRARKLWIARPFALVKVKLSTGGRSSAASLAELKLVRELSVAFTGSTRTTSAGLAALS